MKEKLSEATLVLLTYNARTYLDEFFSSLDKQTLKPELLVLDSESSDGTQEFLKAKEVAFTTIKKKDFNHGETRNQGLRIASHEIVVFVTQDIIFDNEDSLEKLVEPLTHNNGVAMSFGRQLPKEDATILSQFARLNNYPEHSIVKKFDDRTRLGIKTCFISNSYAAYKKTLLRDVGNFPSHLIMCEDVYVGAKALLNGLQIAYVADARVYHSHNYSLIQEFKRYFDIGYFYNSEAWILSNFSKAEGEGLSYLKNEIKFVLKRRKYLTVMELFTRTFLKYVGYLFGKHSKIFPATVKRSFSMHAYYWESETT